MPMLRKILFSNTANVFFTGVLMVLALLVFLHPLPRYLWSFALKNFYLSKYKHAGSTVMHDVENDVNGRMDGDSEDENDIEILSVMQILLTVLILMCYLYHRNWRINRIHQRTADLKGNFAKMRAEGGQYWKIALSIAYLKMHKYGTHLRLHTEPIDVVDNVAEDVADNVADNVADEVAFDFADDFARNFSDDFASDVADHGSDDIGEGAEGGGGDVAENYLRELNVMPASEREKLVKLMQNTLTADEIEDETDQDSAKIKEE